MKRISTIILICITWSFTYSQSAGDLVISEFMANPADVTDANGEYFELFNTTASPIDIETCVIEDDGTNTHIINSSFIIPAGGFAVLGNFDESATSLGLTCNFYEYSNFTLGNSDDEIVITCGTTEVARLNYTNGDPFGAGTAAEISDTNSGCDGVTVPSDYVAATNSINYDPDGDTDEGSPCAAGNSTTGICSVVAVELSNFTASLKNNKTMLEWSTESEVGHDHFMVEWSANAKDFNSLDVVEGAGTSNRNQSYSYIHENPARGNNYYRLKQVDLSGKHSYSLIRQVWVKSDHSDQIHIFPIPASEKIHIGLEPELELQNVTLNIFNLVGQHVRSIQGNEISSDLKLSISDLETGSYVIQITTETTQLTGRFIKS